MIKTFEGCDFWFGDRSSPKANDFMTQQMWACIEAKCCAESGVAGSAQLLALRFERDETMGAFRLDFTFTIEVAG